MNREQVISDLADVYFEFLNSIKWDNQLLLNGLKEGKNKFLSNVYLHLCQGKHSIVNYHSINALEIYKNSSGNLTRGLLVFEHMIPKERYIQKPCEEIIQMEISPELKREKIHQLLDKYWHIASITTSEDKSIKHKKTMPENWDGQNIFARYEVANISTLKNDFWQ